MHRATAGTAATGNFLGGCSTNRTNMTDRKPLLTTPMSSMSTPRMPNLPFLNFSSNFSGMDQMSCYPKSRDFINKPASAVRNNEVNTTQDNGAYLHTD